MFRPEYITELVRLLGRWPPDIFLFNVYWCQPLVVHRFGIQVLHGVELHLSSPIFHNFDTTPHHLQIIQVVKKPAFVAGFVLCFYRVLCCRSLSTLRPITPDGRFANDSKHHDWC